MRLGVSKVPTPDFMAALSSLTLLSARNAGRRKNFFPIMQSRLPKPRLLKKSKMRKPGSNNGHFSAASMWSWKRPASETAIFCFSGVKASAARQPRP